MGRMLALKFDVGLGFFTNPTSNIQAFVHKWKKTLLVQLQLWEFDFCMHNQKKLMIVHISQVGKTMSKW